MKIIYFNIILIQFICFHHFSSADEVIIPENSKNESKLKKLKKKIYSAHDILSRKIIYSTNWVDSFFGEKKHLEEQNGTRLRFIHTTSKFESEDIQNRFNFNANLKLLNLRKRLQLSFEKRDSSLGSSGVVTGQNPLSEQTVVEDEFRTSAHLFLKKMLDFRVKLTTGVKLGIPPRLFSNIRVSRDFSLFKKWNLSMISNSFWQKRNGFGQTLSMDLDRKLNDSFHFRFVNESRWSDSDDTIYVSHGPSLYQKLSDRRGMTYNFRFNYLNRPSYKIDNYNFNVIYRQRIVKTWFFYEIIPQIDFSRSREFHARSGIALRIELSLGEF